VPTPPDRPFIEETESARLAAPARHDALALWGFLAGPVAWAFDLTASYGLEPRVHATGSKLSIHVVTLLALALLLSGAWAALRILRRPSGGPAAPRATLERTRFLALGGLAGAAFFLVVILAEAVPKLLLGARQ
jgi:hypothetical protein